MRGAGLALVGAAVLGGGGTAAGGAPPMRPVPGEAFFGEVVAVAPRAAATATVASRGTIRQVPVAAGIARARVSGPTGPRGATVVLRAAGGSPIAMRRTRDAFLLPASGEVARPGSRPWPRMRRHLARIAARHAGVNAMWAQRLADGRAAGWNADAEFPAASLVKLPLAVGAVMRMGARPWTHPAWQDVSAVLRRSDDRAANRLSESLGSGCAGPDAMAADGLRRLGAAASTYPGCYLVEDDLQPRLPGGGVTAAPAWSSRHTTARDMARMLFSLHAAAVPTPAARRRGGIDPLRARMMLGLLLRAEQVGPNASLFAAGLAPSTPIAEKNGWRSGEQHGAAIAYTAGGPVILVLLTQRAGRADMDDARAIGADMARAAMAG